MTNCSISEDMTGLDGYVSTMTTSDDGKTFTFTNAKRQKLIVSKKSATGSDELPGAKLVVYSVGSDGTQSEIDSWKTESTPHEMQLSPGNYLLRETYAPAGYAMTSDITFTINSDFTVAVTSKSGKLDGQTLTVIDQPLEVKLSKVDLNGNSLAGASMTLTDKNTGKLVHSWVSGTEPEKLVMTGNTGEVLVAGHTYIMHEESDGDPTPGNPGDDLNMPGNAIPNGDGDTPKISPTAPPNVPAFANGQYGLPTGDSPVMWIFLALAVVCIGAAVGVTVVRKKKENGDDASHSDRG